MSIDSNRRQAPGHGCLQENMIKSLRVQASSDEVNVAPIEPVQHEKRGVSQRASTAKTRLVTSDLLDRIQIWVNEGGAGDDAG